MRRALLLACLACLALPAAGGAAPSQESWFQDDNMLEFSETPDVTKTLDRLKTLGVDRIRVSVFWLALAPDGASRTKPSGFDGSDPDAYPQANWRRYDVLVRLAAERGIAILWDVTGPSPAWALKPIKSRPDIADAWYPNPKEFGALVKALGTRYSGSFIRPEDRPKVVEEPGNGIPPGLPGHRPPSTTTTEPGPPLPRVDHWEIWNEPNQGAWLAPQHTRRKIGGRTRWLPTSPRLYRRLADAMYASLVATGHANDTILLGSTAPKGSTDVGISRPMNPRLFIRELYCVDRNNQAYRGTAAKVRGCPQSDPITKVPQRHPVLFRNSGFAHHPYELTFAPSRRPEAGFFTMANLSDLSRTLRFAYLRYRQNVPSNGVPLYLSEYGYQTNPPDRIGVSLAKQAAYLAQAEYLAWRTPAVRSFAQFLLEDGGEPISQTFQTGLLFADGREKPSYQAYKLPIWLPQRRIRPGAKVRVWGLIRPAANGTAPAVEIQFRRNGTKGYRTLATRTASEARGYLFEKVRIPGSGRVRLAWQGNVSRSVTVFAR